MPATAGLSRLDNHKLGPLIHSWSIPAIATCPGASNLCRSKCYAKAGHFVFPAVSAFHRSNDAFSRTNEFVPWMVGELRRQPVRVLRIHVAGDYRDAEYTRKWYEITSRTPNIVHFAYTRSWRVPEILPELIRLSQLPNMRLWFSLDRETGSPPLIPGVRRAYMAIDDIDAQTAPNDCDLVFRTNRRGRLKQANGVLVCPAENGVVGELRHTCTTCGVCWDKQQVSNWEPELLALYQDATGIPICAPAQDAA